MNTSREIKKAQESGKKTRYINFTSMSKPALILSGLLFITSIISLFMQGLNFGVDFTGGTVIEIGYPKAADVDQIRTRLEQDNYDASVQHFGTAKDVLIRLAPTNDEAKSKQGDAVFRLLEKETPGITLRRVEFVGPQIGDELRDQGGTAMLLALAGILIYVTLRFEFRFSVGAIIALVHDVVITVGIFSLTQLEFDLTILAAILAIIGYSLNDTIVVFDRVRENFLRFRKSTPEESINISINHTLSRTILTSMTTLLVLVALFIFGGEIIHNFSLAMILGVIVGTYSSIYIASTSLLLMGVTREALLPPEKEGADELSELP